MNKLLEIDKKNIWHPFTPLAGGIEPLLITSASGIYLHTQDGRSILDAISSWWVNLHGHAHLHLAEALATQAKKLEHVIFAGFTHEPAIQLSKNLLSIVPSNQSKIFFSDNGSTAVEVALKMALQYWHNQKIEKRKIIAFEGAYHGDTFGAMSVGDRGIFTAPFSKYLFDVEFIPFPDQANHQQVIDQFQKSVADQTVAAFIFEPLVQGAAGMRMYSPKILDELIALAHQHDVVCIADEVFTGFGRTGKLFASDYLRNKPDIITLSKGLTGGMMPMGITTCAEKIVVAFDTDEFLKTFFHGHSYTGNPLACAVANASFELLMQDECAASINRITRQHEKFAEKLDGHPNLHDVRTLGTILAIELKTEGGSSYTSDIRKKIYPYFLDRNILLRPLGNILYILPPYCITNEELSIIYRTIEDFLSGLK
ncbi:MAG: adenosylmethionine--8-amino-7-oxononanoate transaminase [Cyclobacteriaceae bacterium]|nr:adenosylmethionine--8-amino-7-oxononanoate transaminase [Cyclobacteriaceae bacterium]